MRSTPPRIRRTETPDRTGAFERIRDHYDEIYVIVSPPRASSTAFGRVFWQHPSVRFYCHEPFEVTYYEQSGLAHVMEKLADPLDLIDVAPCAPDSNSLVIKEMPYQVGDNFDLLASLATRDIIFLTRDPRLNISSRVAKKQETGGSGEFPFVESGWRLLEQQVQRAEELGVRRQIVDANDFRSEPADVFAQVFAGLELDFDPEMLAWEPCERVELDNLAGEHSHLYERVLASRGIEPPDERIPDVAEFAGIDGLEDHAHRCMEVYDRLISLPERVVPQGG